MKKRLFKAALLLCLILSFCFPRTILEGTKNGLLLWYGSVLPSLLPFMILSSLIIKLNLLRRFANFFAPLAKRFFYLPPCSIYPILLGILSGFPVGAKICVDLLNEKKITKNEAQYLVGFCNNSNPMFLIGFISIACLDMKSSLFLIPAIIYGGSLLTALVTRPIFIPTPRPMRKLVVLEDKTYYSLQELFDNCIIGSCMVLLNVGVYIVIFSIGTSFVYLLPNTYPLIKAILIGCFELSNGVKSISVLSLSQDAKIVLASVLAGFGGMSTLAQTESVIAGNGLSTFKYVLCRILNALFSCVLALLLCWFFI